MFCTRLLCNTLEFLPENLTKNSLLYFLKSLEGLQHIDDYSNARVTTTIAPKVAFFGRILFSWAGYNARICRMILNLSSWIYIELWSIILCATTTTTTTTTKTLPGGFVGVGMFLPNSLSPPC